MTAVVTLLTDFGLRDPYVGVMKAVILARAPETRLVDLTHEVPPQSILEGSFALSCAVPYCPPNTIHLAVVDPGVGTDRNAIIVQTRSARYVAPDNGLLTLALRLDPPVAAWRLTRPQYFLPRVSATFHGRDVFAPVAAHLASGVSAEDMGEPLDVTALVRLETAVPVRDGARVRASVLHVDRFGNLITNIHRDDVEPLTVTRARAAAVDARFQKAYGATSAGDYLCIWGSTGHLELSRSMGNAASSLGVGRGDPVEVLLHEREET